MAQLFTSRLAGLLAGALLLGGSAAAQAADVGWSVTVASPVGAPVYGQVVSPAPVYGPAVPVYGRAQPLVVHEVVRRGPPVVVLESPRYGYGPHHHHHHRHGHHGHHGYQSHGGHHGHGGQGWDGGYGHRRR